MNVGKTITIEVATMQSFAPRQPSDPASLVGTARFADCPILERRLVKDGATPTLEYHRTGETARVFCMSENADEIEPAKIGIATMTVEGYWELTAVFC